MNSKTHLKTRCSVSLSLVAALLLLGGACSHRHEPLTERSSDHKLEGLDSTSHLNTTQACALVLTPHRGESALDQEIVRIQEQISKAPASLHLLERLGWLFVSKARVSFDPGFYTLAEQCAVCLEAVRPGNPEALLLRGHVMHNLHQFKEAEELARELVAKRALPYDYGLLGDALLEQGRVKEAADAYQRMMDLRPDLRAYSRAAHVRWLKGDLPGAIDIMQMAATAGSPREAESTAWVYSRLALHQLQAGALEKALEACDLALDFQQDYAPALLARGRIQLSQGQTTKALQALSRAAELNPLPEYLWWYAEALHLADRPLEARPIEEDIRQKGAREDPRTLSLFLATRGEDVDAALRLARAELEKREDVFTLDALAWSLRAAGKIQEAQAAMKRALSEGTKDARLFFHAGVIALEAGEKATSKEWLGKAKAIEQMLLPSEGVQLAAAGRSEELNLTTMQLAKGREQ